MQTTRTLTWLLALALLGFALLTLPISTARAADPVIVRVTPSGTTTWPCGDQSNWSNPCAFGTALTQAPSGSELWVASGTYKPTTATDRTATFQLRDGIALYGGFAGGETLRNQRNFTAHVTILSGDIGALGDSSDNSYHVVTAGSGVTETAVLDGFIVTGGNAIGVSTDAHHRGGGMYNDHSSPTVTNVTFAGNLASWDGGGMYNDGASPTLTNVTFSSDTATTAGGGMYNVNGSPTLTNVTFAGNSADSIGGGMNNYNSSPTLTNVTFSNNSADDGGGMRNFQSNPTLTNVSFISNTAGWGGGIANWNNSSPTIRNTIFWGSTAASGSQIGFDDISTSSVFDSVVQGGCPAVGMCTNIITANPLLGTLGNYGGSTQTIPLLRGSSAIDTGDDVHCAATDQRGVRRPQGAHCDIGAFEFAWVYLPLIRR